MLTAAGIQYLAYRKSRSYTNQKNKIHALRDHPQLRFRNCVTIRCPRIEAEAGFNTARASWHGHSPASIWKDPGCWQEVVIF